jgi:predicted metalloprotease with PDZ domain
MGRFGFAFTCEPRCNASTGRDGALIHTYYKYPDFPPITAIGPGSAAERAGLKVGDLVVSSRAIRCSATKARKAWATAMNGSTETGD